LFVFDNNIYLYGIGISELIALEFAVDPE